MRHTINLSKKKPPSIRIIMVVYVMVIVSFMVKINAQVINNDTIINKDFGNNILKSSIGNLTSRLAVQMETRAPFCIADGQTDWDRTFNYTNNWDFVEACALRDQGDVGARLCSQGEITFYLNSFFNKVGGVKYSEPNRNCNASSWVSGCEPGWACSIDSDNQAILLDPEKGLRDDQIPARTRACRTCCDGFFCPEGLTCMLPCPLGAYCPQATLNESTSLCDPYQYPLPPGRNHTCGGANIWADYGSSKQIFCPAGSYCPTTTDKKACDSGNYCLTGSTSEKKCTTLISCKGNTEKQNIQTYGIMLIVALVAVLLIVYNFSDQLLALRERRRAKFRERAVRSVEQNERVRARWRAAKDAAKKHVSGIQGNFSTRFSQRKIKIGDEGDVKGDDFLLSAQQARNTSDSQPSSIAFEGEIEGSVTEGHLPVDESHKEINLSLEVEGKSPKTIPKGKRVRTGSQIFKYAYAQIEKEKHRERQTEDRSLSGVISMATGDQIVKRPLIEIDFKDLTLTLKGKKRHILKNLTGKISPGHIAAVMGPSGAGKTTLLTALAGKATGCSTSGLVLINGRPESIHSYKKIVGFVPQDDIVHGNLTVEENLWFSARCRLPSNLPGADKVLIVERAIMNLGLHDVRDSLVGTVEERGISGGQKKRVNVGLEMVMEPSLLFLDEPTSGLDSSSSRLLLRALRQEALAGVNICMVVHQPSYALFRMFDDLILLAKGGLMVYNGPVTQVEDYFSGMGIVVPDRVNPPDYFIDILEGLVPSRVNYKELPLRWMLHNGYPVPEDLRSQFAGVEMSQRSESSPSVGENETFAGELWHDVRDNVELRRDQIHLNFLRRMDLSNRRTPGVISQYKYFIGRITKQRLREAKLLATDYLILLLAGACLGAISKISDENFGASGFTYTIIAISLLCQIAALRTFSLDKLQYLRESASGISSLAHFLAKDTIDHFNTVVKPVVYLSMFYFFTNPRSTFVDNYIVMMCLVYCVTGMGYAFATFLNPGPAQLFSVLIPVCLTLISSQSLSNSGLKFIASLCYPKWTLEALVIANAKKYYGVWLINRCGALAKLDYSLHSWKLCIMILLIYGAVSRIIAFIGLLVMRKK